MSRRERRISGDSGQAVVELALVLPLVIGLVLLVAQIALVARDLLLVTHAAREGARAAAVGATDAQVRTAVTRAGPLDPDRVLVRVDRTRDAGLVSVSVTYHDLTDLPLVGDVVPDVDLPAKVTMRQEASAAFDEPRTAVSSREAPALSSGSLPLPHFGDWTHEGQPSSHGQASISSRVAAR